MSITANKAVQKNKQLSNNQKSDQKLNNVQAQPRLKERIEEGWTELKLEELGPVEVHEADIKKQIRAAHLQLHKKDASDKKQQDKREAYDRKFVLTSNAKETLADRKSDRDNFFDSFRAKLEESGQTLGTDTETRERIDTIQCMSSVFGDDLTRSKDMYENLSTNLEDAAPDLVVAKRREIERIFGVIMQLDLKQFEFKENSELVSGDIQAKLQYLSLCPSMHYLMDEYRSMMKMDAGCQMSERMMNELDARVGFMWKFKNAYDFRLKLMSNKYYSLLLKEDTDSLSSEKLTQKYVKAMDDENAELFEYLSLIMEQRGRRKASTPVEAERGQSADELLERERKRVGLKGGEGLEAPGMLRLTELTSGGIEQLDSRQLKLVMNTKRMDKKKELQENLAEFAKIENLPKDVKKVLASITEYSKVDFAAAFGGKERQANRRKSFTLSTLKYGFAILFRHSATGNKVEQERHDYRIAIKELSEIVRKYSGKDRTRYGELTDKLSGLLDKLVIDSGTPLSPLDENAKEAEYRKRGWNRKEGEFKDLNRLGRKRHTVEDDDSSGLSRMLMENNFTVDATKSVLFAHEPCIEDISQGAMGDCFFLSALGTMVQKDPQNIRNMMMDNGDDSVTVRFFDQTDNFKPMYITVSKRVRLTGASHTVWVQVMEKAYTCYLQEINKNILKLKRDGQKHKIINFDPNMIEYGFLSKGGDENDALEAMTGRYGKTIDLRCDSLTKLQCGGEATNVFMNVLKLSMQTTESEQQMTKLRREEVKKEVKLRYQANVIIENDEPIAGYESYWERAQELQDQFSAEQERRKKLSIQESKAPEDQKQLISDQITESVKITDEISRKQDALWDEFRADYINRNMSRKAKHRKKEIEDLKQNIPESRNVLSEKNTGLADMYGLDMNTKVPKDVLYLDKDVDAKIEPLLSTPEKTVSPKKKIKIRQKIAELSEAHAANLLTVILSSLPKEYYNMFTLPAERAKTKDQLPFSLLEEITRKLTSGYVSEEDLYNTSIGIDDQKKLAAEAKELGVDAEKLAVLVKENRQRILDNMCAKLEDMRKYCYEETDEEHPYSTIEEEEFQKIKTALDEGKFVGASTGGPTTFTNNDPAGICNNHAYAVIGTHVDEKGRKFVIVRDPAGGAAGTYDEHGKIKQLSEDESYGVNKLELHHFLRRFDDLSVNG